MWGAGWGRSVSPIISGSRPTVTTLMRWLIRAERGIAVGLMVVLLVFSFTQVVARFVFDSPFTWTDELARFSYVWMTFIAAAAVMAQRGHIAVELGEEKLPSIVKTGLNVFGSAAVFVSCLILAIGAFPMLQESGAGSSTALDIPLSVFYGIVYSALLLIGFHAAVNVIHLLRVARAAGPATASLDVVTRTRPEETI